MDRAWGVIETLLCDEQWDDFTSGFGPKSEVLAAFRANAISVTEKLQTRNLGGNVKNSSSHLGLGTGEDVSRTGIVPACLPGNLGSDEFSFDIESDEWPNWATLAQDF